jgi:hypothetical protein
VRTGNHLFLAGEGEEVCTHCFTHSVTHSLWCHLITSLAHSFAYCDFHFTHCITHSLHHSLTHSLHSIYLIALLSYYPLVFLFHHSNCECVHDNFHSLTLQVCFIPNQCTFIVLLMSRDIIN